MTNHVRTVCGQFVAFVAMWPLVGHPAPGQEADATQSDEQIAETWDQRFLEAAEKYEISMRGRDIALERHPEPILKWGNPVRRQERGSVFVWQRGGRPEVIGTIFTYQLNNNARVKHEFHSLSESPLRARYGSLTAWTPPGPALEWRDYSGPPPSRSAALRLTTMRSIARQFDMTLTNSQGDETRLRLVPQPIFRYQADSSGVVDGAIFSYAVATDPEALLIVEAVESSDVRVWRYAFARFHFWQLDAFDSDGKVWSVQADVSLNPAVLGQQDLLNKIYVTYHVP